MKSGRRGHSYVLTKAELLHVEEMRECTFQPHFVAGASTPLPVTYALNKGTCTVPSNSSEDETKNRRRMRTTRTEEGEEEAKQEAKEEQEKEIEEEEEEEEEE